MPRKTPNAQVDLADTPAAPPRPAAPRPVAPRPVAPAPVAPAPVAPRRAKAAGAPPSKARSKPLLQAAPPLSAGAEDLAASNAETAALPVVAVPKLPPRPRRTAHLAPAGALPPARIPPEALASPRNGRLVAQALGISIVLHAIVLTLHFSPFDLRSFSDNAPPLEVALVNAKTKAKPTKADVLAQANLDGGGNTDQDRRAKTPLPVLPKDSANTNLAVAQQKVEALEKQTQELLTQLKAQASATQQTKPSEVEPTESPTANVMMQRTLESARLEAQIARDMDAYQKRPKRRFVGARATEYRFARYVEDWRLRVERIGNLNYPEAARQNKLYGSLVLTVSIRSDGSVENVEINRSSGRRLLDAAAKKVVEMGAPYSAFPPDIKRDTDILHITRTWTFAKGDELRSQ